jgi:hypothetical protein
LRQTAGAGVGTDEKTTVEFRNLRLEDLEARELKKD